MPISKIHARQIFDSRGNPTVEVDLYTERGMYCVITQHKWEFSLNTGKYYVSLVDCVGHVDGL